MDLLRILWKRKAVRRNKVRVKEVYLFEGG